jgi:hypothetical protein
MILMATLLPFITVAPDHWSLEFQGGLTEAHSGKRALRMTSQGGTGEVSQEIKLQPGRTVSAAVWVKGDHAEVRLLIRDGQGKELSHGSSTAGASWRKLSVHARVPESGAVAKFVLETRGDGHASFDDVTLTEDGREVVANGGFEDGMRSWTAARDGVGAAWVNDSTFVPWGFNYDRTIYQGRDLILEETPIDKVDADFRIARHHGANSLRLFLQLSHFMPRYLEMDPAALELLDQVVARARKYDLKLDLTGLSHIIGVPAWYSGHTTDEIVRAESAFWGAIAKRYAEEPMILDYDLQNEPVVTGADSELTAVGCFTMSEKRQFCYVNRHRLDEAAGREETARRWTAAMVAAIREHDRRHLITIGMLPTASPTNGYPNPAFNVRALAPLVDFISLHFYPQHPAADVLQANQDRLEMILRYAGEFGKPVVMEEWFPIYPPKSGLREGDWFPHAMEASRANAAGWFTFYHEVLKCADCKPGDHLRQFSENADAMRAMSPKRAAATTKMAIDAEKLWRSKEDVEKLLGEYQALRRSGAVPDFTENQTR